MFYLTSGNYLVTMKQFQKETSWGELLIDQISPSARRSARCLYHLTTVGTVWFHIDGRVCFYLSEEFFEHDSTVLALRILHELYNNGIKRPSISYDCYPVPVAKLLENLNSKTYVEAALEFK